LFTTAAFYGRIFTYGGNKEDSKPSANVKKIVKSCLQLLLFMVEYSHTAATKKIQNLLPT